MNSRKRRLKNVLVLLLLRVLVKIPSWGWMPTSILRNITGFGVFLRQPLPWLEKMCRLRSVPAAASGGSIHTELCVVGQLPPPFLPTNAEETAVEYEIARAERSPGQVA